MSEPAVGDGRGEGRERPVVPALFDEPAPDTLRTASPPSAEAVRAEVPLPDAGTAPVAPVGPALLDAPDDAASGPIDHGWAPAALRARTAPAGTVGWIAGGLAGLLLGWLALDAAGFVQDQYARSPAMGHATLAVFALAALAVARGLWGEARAYARLRHVGALRARLADDAGPVEPARALALEWLGEVSPRLPDPATAHAAVQAAADIPLLRAALRRHLGEPLRRAARAAGRWAATEGAAVVAISPSPALDGVLAGLRGLGLVRQVAAIHGQRPGAAVTVALLRRVAWTAAGTAGTGALAQGAAEAVLGHVPIVKHVAAAMPEAGVTAWRLQRLADVTARACSPLTEG